MGCGCQKVGSFYYIAPSGQEQKFATEIEAMAAKIRAGNVGEVVKK